jgi:predicted secreted protein
MTLKKVLVAWSTALLAATAHAQVYPPPQNVLNLSANASVEVARDVLGVVFTTMREGADAAAVQVQLKLALDAALAEARKVAKPGEVDVSTGNFSLNPRYQPKGGIAGWQGTAELVVEGRDVAAISRLTGRIQSMTIARVGFSLSRQAREKAEAEAAALAIGRFKAKAEETARLFGFGGYSLREVTLDGNVPGPGVPMLRMQATRAISEEAPLPVEAGTGTVTVTVNGSVQLSPR